MRNYLKCNINRNEKKINKFLGITTNPHMKTQSTLSLNETSSLPEIEKSKTETSKLSEFHNRKTGTNRKIAKRICRKGKIIKR